MDASKIIEQGRPVEPPLSELKSLMEKIVVPNLYLWLEYLDGKPILMVSAFNWKGINYGYSYPVEENAVRNWMNKKKLLQLMKESLDVLVHHGKEILDSSGNINPKLVNDAEARRFFLDPLWKKRVAAFEKVVKVKEITKEEAIRLKLI